MIDNWNKLNWKRCLIIENTQHYIFIQSSSDLLLFFVVEQLWKLSYELLAVQCLLLWILFSWETGCFGDDSLNPGIALVVSVSCVAIYEAGVKWSPSRQCRHMLSIASAHSSTSEHKKILHQKAHQRYCDIMWYYNSYALYMTEECVSNWQKWSVFLVVCSCCNLDVKDPCIVKDFYKEIFNPTNPKFL